MQTKMVNLAQKLAAVLGKDAQKYEAAMSNRIKQEVKLEILELDEPEDKQRKQEEINLWDNDDEDNTDTRMKHHRKVTRKHKEKEKTIQRRKQRQRKMRDF